MKKYLSLLLIFGFLLTLVACTDYFDDNGEEFDFGQNHVKQTVLKVWYDDTDGNFMAEVKRLFEEENPGIIVEFTQKGTVEAREDLKTYGPTNHGADVFQFPHDHMAQAILDDLVYPLPDDLYERLEQRIMPVALDIATVCYDPATKSFECGAGSKEKLFAVPQSIESVFLFYNKKLVKEEDLPQSFEELIQDAKAYEAQAGAGKRYFGTTSHWADSYFVQFAFSAFGWIPFGPDLNDATKVGFEKPELQNALKWLVEQIKPITTGNNNHDSGKNGTDFEAGDLPIVLGGPWNVESFRNAKVDFGAITIPTINVNGEDVTPRTYAGAQMLAVYKQTKHPDAAIKFVEFCQSDKVSQLLYEMKGKIPALKPDRLENIEGIKDDPIAQVMLEQLETSYPMPTIPEVTHYWGPAEAMIKNIWNSGNDISYETKKAENAYKSLKDLASGKSE
ncbi:MAG TPA: extracellular solute-binding protein [Bacilli bacterium]